MIRTAWGNLLEASVVTLEAGTEDGAYPLYRLYDRMGSRPFRPVAAETVSVLVDQGAEGASAVGMLALAPGHNLDSMTLDIECSEDGVAYVPAVAQWVGSAGAIVKEWEPLVRRYWRLTVTDPAAVPSIGEMVLSAAYEWERPPARPARNLDPLLNVELAETSSGGARLLVHGPPRRRRRYDVTGCGASQRDEALALWEAQGAGMPVWMRDEGGRWIWGALAGGLDMREVAHGVYAYSFDFQEVL